MECLGPSDLPMRNRPIRPGKRGTAMACPAKDQLGPDGWKFSRCSSCPARPERGAEGEVWVERPLRKVVIAKQEVEMR